MTAAPGHLTLESRVATLYRFSRITVLLTLVLAPIVVWRGTPHAAPGPLLAWLGFIVAVSLARWILLRRHAVRARGDNPRFWARLSVAGAALVGVGWGWLALPWAGFSSAAMPAIIILLIAVAAIGLYSYMPYWPAYLALVIPIASCAIVGVVTNRVVMSVEFVLIILALASILIIACLRVGRHYEQLLLARYEAARLAEAANAASRAKSLFLANIGHEIRTPLNTVMGFGHLLRDAPLARTELNQVDGMLAAGNRVLGVLDEILEYCTLEAGNLELNPKPTSLHRLMQELAQTYRALAEAKGLRFTLDVDPAAADGAFVDEARVRQVLGILVRNAIKFTLTGEISVRLAAPVQRGARVMQRFEVEDSGVGIEDGLRSHLFEPFWQADASAARRFGGTGLGLALARQLAELHGGELSHASRAAGGSIFSLEIPLQATELPPRDPPIRALREPLQGRILLAEDEPLNRRLTVMILERMGLSVDTASDGREALEAVRRQPPDVVLMDCQMPGMDGYAAARAIRALPGVPRIPIIALTAHAMKGADAECLAAGMDDYLTKPIDVAALRVCMERYLTVDPGTQSVA